LITFIVAILLFELKKKDMSRLLTGIVLIGVSLLTSCSGGKSSSSSKGYLKSSTPQNNPAANNSYAPPSNSSVDKSQYVAFSRELQMKLMAYNVDVKRVQFYIDQKLILTRALDSAKAEVASGSVRFINGKLINEIIIPAYTPGIIESADLNGLRVSFENGNSFYFVPAEGEDKFVVAGNNWDNGTVEIPYDKNIYRAAAGVANGSVADIKLVVKLTDVTKSDKKTRTLQGRKLGL
jgi:hypothetical protein